MKKKLILVISLILVASILLLLFWNRSNQVDLTIKNVNADLNGRIIIQTDYGDQRETIKEIKSGGLTINKEYHSISNYDFKGDCRINLIYRNVNNKNQTVIVVPYVTHKTSKVELKISLSEENGFIFADINSKTPNTNKNFKEKLGD
ncbi:hypothetical protein [Peribacillus muralis]|uniref:hypothetical protein n=1 Tax=Peribacillus muralis TaxID=264697 RepID=UPI00366C2EDD